MPVISQPASEIDVTRSWLRALELTVPIAKTPLRTFPTVIAELAQRFGNAPALIGEQESFSFRDLLDRSNATPAGRGHRKGTKRHGSRLSDSPE
jgi:fatty-acyl-CoA synthase